MEVNDSTVWRVIIDNNPPVDETASSRQLAVQKVLRNCRTDNWDGRNYSCTYCGCKDFNLTLEKSIYVYDQALVSCAACGRSHNTIGVICESVHPVSMSNHSEIPILFEKEIQALRDAVHRNNSLMTLAIIRPESHSCFVVLDRGDKIDLMYKKPPSTWYLGMIVSIIKVLTRSLFDATKLVNLIKNEVHKQYLLGLDDNDVHVGARDKDDHNPSIGGV